MKILHTADWHLGQKFLFKDRAEEHQLALDWLEQIIQKEKIDVLIVAGDVFDIQNPPNYARRLYYNFLVKIATSSCRHIVIIGGNHDSPSQLNADSELLKLNNIQVLGCATENLEDELIELQDDEGNLEAVIAAVPFLRDQDIRRSVGDETDLERIERIKKGIYNHYNSIGELVKPYSKKKVPIIATGHLYAKGAKASDEQNNIYIGNRENISAEQFPKVFNYVALGHIHRAQYLGERKEVRYSGSIIPLRFKETKDDKSVTIVEFDAKKIKEINLIPVPEFRRLKTIEGDLEKIKSSLSRFAAKTHRQLTPWVEIILQDEQLIPDADRYIRDFAKEMNLEILKVRVQRKHQDLAMQANTLSLDELDPEEVFEKKIAAVSADSDKKELLNTFRELRNWMQENDNE